MALLPLRLSSTTLLMSTLITDCQLVTPFGATTCEHFTTVLGSHACTESVSILRFTAAVDMFFSFFLWNTKFELQNRYFQPNESNFLFKGLFVFLFSGDRLNRQSDRNYRAKHLLRSLDMKITFVQLYNLFGNCKPKPTPCCSWSRQSNC